MGTDTRFYSRLGPLTAEHLASISEARLAAGGDVLIEDVAEPAAAGPGCLVFLTSSNGLMNGLPAGAAAIVPEGMEADAPEGVAVLVHRSPKAAFAKAAQALLEPRRNEAEALVADSAEVHADARLSPGCVIGPGAIIEADAQICAGAVIGPGCVIGEGTRIGPRAVITFALVGARCEIGAGAVIGETGFGLVQDQGSLLTLPHLGRVIIGDEVTIGANTTIDRGMLSDTRLGRGCRIDNLCHVGHNVEVGEFAVMAAFAGISGSVKIGAGAQFGGRVGVADHLTIGKGARLAADSAVMRDVPDGETWAGSPAQPIQRFMRETAWVRREAGRKGAKSSRKTEG
ncbi:UDP-3-O-(3-hydroxymyristoyl)glucosamine N-acyltransferase [Glycocaulis profundi]|nr:UDP-3-O-(3-hydroxymyristoyl)glucosamine N-acyltransferase [Glycocaulis profundi]